MSEISVRVENLGKLYRIGQIVGYGTLRESLMNAVAAPFRRLRSARHEPSPTSHHELRAISHQPDYIWALKDVSFEIKRGEAVGIIGRNGSGKTTILKILSRITAPTEGYAEIHGRVGSLLEVGTGFHPELTGRENIYLNGAVIGIGRAEIKRKFDEIVAFSEIEKFLDTPVKRYSSGMYVRLAFAVAAHLEPEILIVDEVLAVGDAQFQKKCLGKMGSEAKGGRTILFVSHNMAAIESICSRVLLLERGRVELFGETRDVVSSYLARNWQQETNPLSTNSRTGNGKVRVVSSHMESPDGAVIQSARSGEPVIFVFRFENHGCDITDRVSFSFGVHTDREFGLFHYYSHFSNILFENLAQAGCFKCLIPELPLAPGNYLLQCRVVMNGDQNTGEEVDWPRVFIPITVVAGDFYRIGNYNLSTWGPILVKGTWSIVGGRVTQ